MMRKKKNLIIVSLCTLLFFMGVGYALMSETLFISGTGKVVGTWDIIIESITPTTENGSGMSKSALIGDDKLSATFAADLYAVGDYVEYTIVVRNNGNIAAELTNINTEVTNRSDFVNFSTDLTTGGILNPGKSITFTAKIYVDDSTGNPLEDALGVQYKMILTFNQSEESNQTLIATNNNCFEIDDTGLITKYDLACGTNVVVPEKVNNINVKYIDYYSFKKYNVIYGIDMNTYSDFFIVKNGENFDAIEQTIIESGQFYEPIIQKENEPIPETVEIYYPMYVNLESLTVEVAINEITSIDFSKATYLTEIRYNTFSDPDSFCVAFKTSSSNDTITNRCIGQEGYNEIKMGLSKGVLTSVKFGTLRNLVSIGDAAFGNNKLTEVDLTGLYNLVYIGNSAFANNLMSNLLLPLSTNAKLNSIEQSAFSHNLLSNVIIPDSVTKIGTSAFSFNQISNVKLSNNLNKIYDGSFFKNNLTTVLIPQSVTRIDNYAFSHNQITSVKFQNPNYTSLYTNPGWGTPTLSYEEP